MFQNDVRVLSGVTWGIAFVIGFVGNIFIINVISKLLDKRKNIPNCMILSLCIVDLINVIVTYIQPIVVYINNGKYLGSGTVCQIQTFIIIFLHSFSVLLLLGTTFERYYAVAKPYSYQEYMIYSKSKIYGFAFVCFLIALGVSLPTVLGASQNELYFPGTYCMFTLSISKSRDHANVIFYITILSLVLLLTTIGNIASCFTVNNMKSFRQQHATTQQRTSKSEEYLFMRLCLVTLFIVLSLWTPLLVCLCIALHGTSNLSEWYILISFRLAALHSVVNPWLYPLLRKRFRKALLWYVTNTCHFLTCSMISRQQYTIAEILSDSPPDRKTQQQQQQQQQRQNQQQHEEQSHDKDTNNLFNKAQRNMADYVDAPTPILSKNRDSEDSCDGDRQNPSNEDQVVIHSDNKAIKQQAEDDNR